MDEVLGILILAILELTIIIYLLFELKNTTLETIEDLDENLARALQATIAEIMENAPDVNPFQQLILEWIKKSPAGGIPELVELPRSEKGRFEAKD